MNNKKEVMEIVRQCWDIAENVKLGNTLQGMYASDAEGTIRTARWHTYLCLLQCLLPKSAFTMSAEMKMPKEDWEG